MTPGNTVPGWPDLSAYPAWVNTLAGALFALGIAVVAVATFFGQLRGKRLPIEDRAGSAQLAMVTLDSTAIREHTRAVVLVGEQLTRLNAIGTRYVESLEQRQEEDELRAAEQRGYERAQAERRPAPRRGPPPKKPGSMNLLPNQRP